jgi:UDP-N-acetylmuramoylalanine--D-glutamate ligase
MQDYARAKWRLQHLLKENGKLFVQKQTFEEFSHLLQIQNYEKIEFELPSDYRNMPKHDVENAAAAWELCRPFISSEQFGKALKTFQKPPHRIEFVRELNGVQFFDDSKGTNIDAVIQAVYAMSGNVILIVGGLDKGASYLPWTEFCAKVKLVIALGAAAPKIVEELHQTFKIEIADSLASAVQMAASVAKRGDCVLLSPGCASFDMFRDYAHRGEEFQRYVQTLT